MPTLELTKLDKRYGAVHAVRGVSARFEPGRVHAVVGENGAGKSTLLKMAAGLVVPDGGEVKIDDRALAPHTAKEAISRGVGMVEQHFALIGVLTALENVVLGRETTRAMGRLDLRAARARLAEIARELGVEIAADARVETLGVGDRQRLEIARTLYRDARVVILDEPTAVLTPAEADALYATLRRLADGGRAIVVVTHKLDEVEAHADVVSVMRRGELVWTKEKRDVGKDALAEAIMGGAVPAAPTRDRAPGEVALAARALHKGRALRGLSLEVRAGEIVGLAGVEGNGQRELVRVLAGLERPDSGTVEVRGVSVVHEDRHAEGLVLDATVEENLLLGELPRFSRAFGVLDRAKMRETARARMERAGVVPPDLDAPARGLSGGNQQKIVVERAIARSRGRAALILAHPTRGVDLGAARAIHASIAEVAQGGVAVLIVSSDLNELRELADRVLVIARGTIVRELPPSASDREIGAAMLGTG